MSEYINELPLPESQIPQTLKDLLSSVSAINPQSDVVVTYRFEHERYKDNYEYLHMIMAVVPEENILSLTVLNESSDGVVKSSTPDCRAKGGQRDYDISISGNGYIVASWGDNSHFSFFLAEDVWMMLGLKPRLVGESEQKAYFDEMSLPDVGIAHGDVSSEYYFGSSKDIKWTMRNDYLRKYLWMKGCVGVRVFYYETYIPRTDEVIKLLDGGTHFKFEQSWIDFEIVDHGDRVILQIWGTVQAVQPELCEQLDKDTLVWPGHSESMTRQRASDIRLNEFVYVDDSFLTRYEKDDSFDSVPFHDGSGYRTDPSYGGQWSFRGCTRIGRNLVKIPFYELYRGIPDREVYHVFDYAKNPTLIQESEYVGENIASKTFRFTKELVNLNDNLVALGNIVGVPLSHSDIYGFNREEFDAEGIRNYPVLQKLAYVAPNNMQEQDFLSRCKTINEIVNKIKVGTLRKLLVAMGVPKQEISSYQAFRLLQAILNLCQPIVDQNEDTSALCHANNFSDFKLQNEKLAPLFINNDLRNAESHEAVGKAIDYLEKLGLDKARLASGYAEALDFTFDGVINSLVIFNRTLSDAMS